MVLYDGTKVTANEEENADLFWAVRGGGSGLGVITSMTTAVVQSPEPTSGERKFLQFRLYYKHDDGKRKTFLDLVQKFLYESPDSPRYGGGGGFGDEESHLQGIFLGSIDDFLDIFGDAGLLDANLLDETKPTDCLSNYEVCEYPDDLPTLGLKVREFESYGEAILTNICMAKVEAPATNLLMISLSEGLSWCKDLGISEDKCFDVAVPGAPGVPDIPMRLPDCDDPDVISAFADAAIDPISFMNRQGPFAVGAGGPGGLLLPRLEVDLFNQLAKEVGIGVNHLQHGAAMSKSTSDTAYPWRDTALLIEKAGPTGSDDLTKIANLLATQHYEDGSKLQGYYNYMNPPGNPNWKYYYFGDNYERLSQIKAKYDPLNYFGNPYQVEPAVDVASAPSIDENGSKISAIS